MNAEASDLIRAEGKMPCTSAARSRPAIHSRTPSTAAAAADTHWIQARACCATSTSNQVQCQIRGELTSLNSFSSTLSFMVFFSLPRSAFAFFVFVLTLSISAFCHTAHTVSGACRAQTPADGPLPRLCSL